jgi:hypothetical protein
MHFQVGTAIHLNVRYSDPEAAKNTIRPDHPPTLMQQNQTGPARRTGFCTSQRRHELDRLRDGRRRCES